jgi:hypothetical protein
VQPSEKFVEVFKEQNLARRQGQLMTSRKA